MIRKLGNCSSFSRFCFRVGLCIPFLLMCACDVLWEPIESTGELTATPQAIASITVKFDVDQLEPPNNKKIKLVLPGDLKIEATLTDFEEGKDGKRNYIWRGEIAGDPGGTVVLSVVNSKLLGDIHTSNGRIFTIRYIRENVALVEELDPAKFPREEANGRDAAYELAKKLAISGAVVASRRFKRYLPKPGSPPPEKAAAPPEESEPPPKESPAPAKKYIDVLVLYTAAAAAWVNSDPDLVKEKIDQAISDSNHSFEESKVSQEVRLAFHKQTAYTEQSGLDLDWLTLKDRLDAKFQEVNGLITTHHADIVVLMTRPALDESQGGTCGAASQMHQLQKSFCASAVAVVPINCATTQHSFAHELGHVMGADHNNGAFVFSPPFDHSRGYLNPSNKWRTIMAEPTGQCVATSCVRVRHWSNPNVNYVTGEPTGSSTEDNAKSLNLTAPYVSEFSDECIDNQLLPPDGF